MSRVLHNSKSATVFNLSFNISGGHETLRLVLHARDFQCLHCSRALWTLATLTILGDHHPFVSRRPFNPLPVMNFRILLVSQWQTLCGGYMVGTSINSKLANPMNDPIPSERSTFLLILRHSPHNANHLVSAHVSRFGFHHSSGIQYLEQSSFHTVRTSLQNIAILLIPSIGTTLDSASCSLLVEYFPMLLGPGVYS